MKLINIEIGALLGNSDFAADQIRNIALSGGLCLSKIDQIIKYCDEIKTISDEICKKLDNDI